MENITVPPTTPIIDPVIRTCQVGNHLGGISVQQVYRLIARGELTKVRLGARSTGVRLSDIEEYIARQQAAKVSD
jgi:predicted DNA-binding transcriptional regulator AlpA